MALATPETSISPLEIEIAKIALVVAIAPLAVEISSFVMKIATLQE